MNIKQAKQIALDDFLARLGCSPTRNSVTQSWYLSPIRTEDTASFKVNRSRNLWFDFGSGEGGDILDLMMKLESLSSIADALARIGDIMGTQTSVEPQREPPHPHIDAPAEAMTFGPMQSRWLFAYLRSRGINPNKALPYLKLATYDYRGTKQQALAFANDAGGYELRNPNYKRSYGKKAIRTVVRRSKSVLVFEGFFDFLTSLMVPAIDSRSSVIVLNSVSLKDQAVAKIKELGVTRVELFCDHDRAGREFLDKLVAELPGIECIDRSELYIGFKDLNEWHVAQETVAV